MELSGKSVLVTGACGTVGSVVVRRLVAEGMQVRAMVQQPQLLNQAGVDIFQASLGDRDAIGAAVRGMQLVVHCAGIVEASPDVYKLANIDGTQHLVDAMRAAGCELLIQMSSVAAYDYRTELQVFAESHPLWMEPIVTWYGYSKAESERIIKRSGVPAVILRPVLVLSMHPTSYFGPRALQRARQGVPVVEELGDIPYVHAENVADAVARAARTPAAVGQAYNVVDGQGDRRAYLDAVHTAAGLSPPDLGQPVRHPVFSGEKIRRELGYAPRDRWSEFLGEIDPRQSTVDLEQRIADLDPTLGRMDYGIQRRGTYVVPPTKEDLQWVIRNFENKEIAESFGFYTESSGRYREHPQEILLSRYKKRDLIIAIIKRVATRERVGFVIMFPPINEEWWEFSYAIPDPKHRNAFDALNTTDIMSHYLFDHLNIVAIGWRFAVENISSISVVRRIGYKPNEQRLLDGRLFDFYAHRRDLWERRVEKLKRGEEKNPSGLPGLFVTLFPPYEPLPFSGAPRQPKVGHGD